MHIVLARYVEIPVAKQIVDFALQVEQRGLGDGDVFGLWLRLRDVSEADLGSLVVIVQGLVELAVVF